MHTWVRKGIALAVSGVLTVGMAASLPFSSFAESAGENVIFQAECEDLDGATTWTDIYGQQFPGYSGRRSGVRQALSSMMTSWAVLQVWPGWRRYPQKRVAGTW